MEPKALKELLEPFHIGGTVIIGLTVVVAAVFAYKSYLEIQYYKVSIEALKTGK